MEANQENGLPRTAKWGQEILLETRIGSSFQVAYFLRLAAVADYAWGILYAGLLDPRVGRAATGWNVPWQVGGQSGAGAPGILFIMPAIIGAALLAKSSEYSV